MIKLSWQVLEGGHILTNDHTRSYPIPVEVDGSVAVGKREANMFFCQTFSCVRLVPHRPPFSFLKAGW